jgi:hypothetical protein
MTGPFLSCFVTISSRYFPSFIFGLFPESPALSKSDALPENPLSALLEFPESTVFFWELVELERLFWESFFLGLSSTATGGRSRCG